MAEQELRRVILREGERGGEGKRGCGDPYFGAKLRRWSSSSGKRQTAARCEAPELGKSFKSGNLRYGLRERRLRLRVDGARGGHAALFMGTEGEPWRARQGAERRCGVRLDSAESVPDPG